MSLLDQLVLQIRLSGHSLLEALIELWRPAVVLGLGGKFPLLVTQVRANDVDFDERPEALCFPFQVISSDHWTQKARVGNMSNKSITNFQHD